MKLIFDTKDNDKQKQAARYWIDPTVKEIGYGGGKGGGKSFLGANLIFGDAFLYPETHYFIARKKLNDLRKFTIPTIFEVFQSWGIDKSMYSFNATDNLFTLNNGSKVFLIEAKLMPSDPQYMRFGSMMMTRGWIEESGEFEYDARANLAASIGRWKNDLYNLSPKLLETCNPSKNYMYELYYKLGKKNELPDYRKFVTALIGDNKMIPEDYINQLNRVLTRNQKERLIMGNWEYDDDPLALCDYENILEMFNTNLSFSGTKYITCDAARFGSDKAVIMVWDGWNVIDIFTFDISKTTDIQIKIMELQKKYGVSSKNTIVDQDGVGGGIVDNLNCKGFANGSRPIEVKGKKENYVNLKSQCGFGLAEKINQNLISFKMPLEYSIKERIIAELEVLKRTEDDKKLALISKDDMKKLLGHSPDYMDNMIMRYYFDVKPPIEAPKYSF